MILHHHKHRTRTTQILPDDILAEAVPGNIRRAEHFLSFLNGVVEFLKKSIDVKDVVKKIPTTLRSELLEFLEITDRKPLRFCYTRLNRLLRTLEITDVAEYTPLSLVADFTTVLATYDEGFMLIIEPTQSHAPNLVDPLMQLTCTLGSMKSFSQNTNQHPNTNRYRLLTRDATRVQKLSKCHHYIRNALTDFVVSSLAELYTQDLSGV